MRSILILASLCALLAAAQSLLPGGADVYGSAGTALSFGFLLLAAFFGGDLIAQLGLPRLVGYLLAGLVTGPDVLGLVSQATTDQLDLVSGVATCLIALTAGGELNLQRLRPVLRVVLGLSLGSVTVTAVVLAGALFLAASEIAFLADLRGWSLAAVCLALGVVLSAQSPAAVMALIAETRADGVLSRTILGTVIIGDLVVIVLFVSASAVARTATGGDADAIETFTAVLWQLFGSMAAGTAIGMILAIYLRHVRQGVSLFVLVWCIVVAEIGTRTNLDPLITMLAAGLFISNFFDTESSPLIRNLEGASLPVYLVFFAVAGATIRVPLILQVGVQALALLALRAASFWLTSRVVTLGPNVPASISRWAWTGLLPQAGLALALAVLVHRTLPGIGEGASALLLTVVALNELFMPAVLSRALIRSGEAGQADAAERFSYPLEEKI
ncbi:MAG: cation:proton antiporter [Polyangiales bacterium]